MCCTESSSALFACTRQQNKCKVRHEVIKSVLSGATLLTAQKMLITRMPQAIAAAAHAIINHCYADEQASVF